MWFYLEFKNGDEPVSRQPVFVTGAPPEEAPTHHHLAWACLNDEKWESITFEGHSKNWPNEKATKRFVKTPEGIFPHKCVEDDCDSIVEFDDEPRCFTHSPDEGSSVHNYSCRKGLM